MGEIPKLTGTINFHREHLGCERRYGTHSAMRVGLNRPIMRETLEKVWAPQNLAV